MEDETTTGSVSTDTGATLAINGIAVDNDGNALPETSVETIETADTTTSNTPEETTEESTETTGAQEVALPAVDDKLKSFAKGQGIDDVSSLTKREQALLKSAYDNKAAYDRTKATELVDASNIKPDQIDANATNEQRENIRLRNLELRIEASSWKQQNLDKAVLEHEMSQILVDDPNKRLLVQEGLLSLDDIYAMAKGRSGSDNDLKAQGKREALETLAGKQQAAVPRGNAVNSNLNTEAAITPQNVDALVGSHDLAWFNQNRDAINKAMAG